MTQRRISVPIRVGGVTVGGGAPVVVQSMTKTFTSDVASTVAQIKELEEHGCEIVRSAVPDQEAADALSLIKRQISIPLIADIHFDHRLALVARMVQAAMGQIKLLEDLDFNLIKVSLKAFDVPTTIEAYKAIAGMMPYPLHLGITEAGTPQRGSIRSAVGIGAMLYLGLGDTIRVSLTGHPREEVAVAYEILKSLNLRDRGPTMVSCPTCGRWQVDLVGLAQTVEQRMATVGRPLKVAVMGCVVNGPGEAREADLGIACGKGKGAIFRKGELVCTVDEADIIETFMAEVEKLRW